MKKNLVEAFGETKCVADWCRDSRCTVPYTTLVDRLKRGVAPEIAITADYRSADIQEAFGERKTLSEWAKDPRCSVSYNSLTLRVREGVPLEEAITKKRLEINGIELWGGKKPLEHWIKDSRTVAGRTTIFSRLRDGWSLKEALSTPAPRTGRISDTVIKAFGEEKTITEWLKDSRCDVSYSTLYSRIFSLGWSEEDAILRKSRKYKKRKK